MYWPDEVTRVRRATSHEMGLPTGGLDRGALGSSGASTSDTWPAGCQPRAHAVQPQARVTTNHSVTRCDTNSSCSCLTSCYKQRVANEKSNEKDIEPVEPATEADRDESSPRKERVLHTRVPAVLEDELKRLATNLRMPVSNVVRAILDDALEAVEVVGVRAEDELKGFVHQLSEQREAIRQGATSAVRGATKVAKKDAAPEPAPTPTASAPAATLCPETAPSLDDVIGFQRLVLRADSTCTVCGKALPKGAEACRGVRDDGGPKVLVGPSCRLLPVMDE